MATDLTDLLPASEKLNVGIVLYPNVEELDFVGPYETFKACGFQEADLRGWDASRVTVFTVAETSDLVATNGGLRIKPDYGFADAPTIDLLVVPGGNSSAQAENAAMMGWLGDVTKKSRLNSSVCTGAFMLAKLGLLDGHNATTHWSGVDSLAERYPAITVQRDVRWVDEGAIVTAAGVSAGIDMSLHLVERLLGRDVAESTARYMEYNWNEN